MESKDGGLNVILKYALLSARVAPNKKVIFIAEVEIEYYQQVSEITRETAEI